MAESSKGFDDRWGHSCLDRDGHALVYAEPRSLDDRLRTQPEVNQPRNHLSRCLGDAEAARGAYRGSSAALIVNYHRADRARLPLSGRDHIRAARLQVEPKRHVIQSDPKIADTHNGPEEMPEGLSERHHVSGGIGSDQVSGVTGRAQTWLRGSVRALTQRRSCVMQVECLAP
jgi:hypothetical protein